jgi:hypothetical protein
MTIKYGAKLCTEFSRRWWCLACVNTEGTEEVQNVHMSVMLSVCIAESIAMLVSNGC